MARNLTQLSDHLYQFTDTCNVYLITDGEHGLVIDTGSGAIVDHCDQAGVDHVE